MTLIKPQNKGLNPYVVNPLFYNKPLNKPPILGSYQKLAL